MTALHWAVKLNDEKITKLLLLHKSDVNACNEVNLYYYRKIKTVYILL